MNFLSFQRVLIVSILCIILQNNVTLAQNNPLDSVQLIAQKEHKKILLYFSGSDWCGPCIKFKQNFIQNADFQSFANDNIIILNADFPRKKTNQLPKTKIQENEILAEKYNQKGLFPYIILFDENGKALKHWDAVPKVTPDEFIQQIKN
ncbi:MAG: thioredoxin family protein [Saprospiraceae bacterium]